MTAECDEEIVKLQMQIDTITQNHQNRTGDEKRVRQHKSNTQSSRKAY